MRHIRRPPRAAAALLLSAVAGAVIGCGQQPEANATDPETTAYKQFKSAGRLFDCLPAYEIVLAAGRTETFDIPALRTAAREYSERTTVYVAALDRIDFPGDAEAIAGELGDVVTAEITSLVLLSGISLRSDAYPLLNQVYYSEAAFNDVSDRLREALDRPVPLATRALSRFELVRQTAQKDVSTVNRLFDNALASGDFDAARNVSGIQQELLTRFSSSLDAIDFPDAFDARVTDLKAKIQADVAYHQRQVDVPNVAMIVPTPAEGGPDFHAREEAAAAIADDLAKVDPPQYRQPDCSGR